MNDRGGQPYLTGFDLLGTDKTVTATHRISPTRQVRKLLGLSGRQWKKLLKAERRQARASQAGLVAVEVP